MPKRKSDFHDENRKRVRRDTQQDISKLFKKRKSVRKPPEKYVLKKYDRTGWATIFW